MTRRALLAGAATTAMPAPSNRILDPHFHVYERDPRFPFWKGNPTHPTDDKTPEMLIDLMRAEELLCGYDVRWAEHHLSAAQAA